MSKSPEEYFQDQSFAPAAPGASFSDAELAFIRKYMGLDAVGTLGKLGLTSAVEAKPVADAPAEPVQAVEQLSPEVTVPATPAAVSAEAPLAVELVEVPPVQAVSITEPVLEPGDAEMLAMAGEEDGALDLVPEAEPQAVTLAHQDAVQPAPESATSAPVPATSVAEPELEPGDAAMLAMAGEGEALDGMAEPAPQKVEFVPQATVETVPPQPMVESPEPPQEPAMAEKPEPVAVKPEVIPAPAVQAPHDLHSEMGAEESLDVILRREEQIQMVGFFLGKQEFTVPILAVQEVIRYEKPARMPAAPDFVAGVINLRGKMTPLVHLRDMLEIKQPRETEDRFIIVCRRKGLQIGLIIERVHTMYRVPQSDIDWGVEGLLGINSADFISSLLKLDENLVGVVSIDRIVDYILN